MWEDGGQNQEGKLKMKRETQGLKSMQCVLVMAGCGRMGVAAEAKKNGIEILNLNDWKKFNPVIQIRKWGGDVLEKTINLNLVKWAGGTSS